MCALTYQTLLTINAHEMMIRSGTMLAEVAVLAGPTPLNPLSNSIFLEYIRHKAEIIAGLSLCFVNRGGAEALLLKHLAHGYVKIIRVC